MPPRIVVSFRGTVPAEPDGGARYLERAIALRQRAGALGGTLCAWSATTFSFDFAPEDIEEALTFAMLVAEGPLAEAMPAAHRFGASVAEGDLEAIGESGSHATLAWGRPLMVATALLREAPAGVAVVDGDLAKRRGGELDALGYRATGATGDRARRLARAGSASPLQPPGATPATAPQAILPPPRGSSPSLPPFPPPIPPPAPTPAPTSHASQPSVKPPPSGPVSSRDSVADALPELAKKALLQGDISAVERLIEQLRATGEHGELVERMSGIAALRRGATADALRRLRAAADAVKEPAQKARARLAYGVALATAGRTDSALLEALDALARAREASDALGEHACARFLARLSAAAGHADAAGVWARIAARTAPPTGSTTDQ